MEALCGSLRRYTSEGRISMVERESWVMVYLLIVGERRGRMTGLDGGGLDESHEYCLRPQAHQTEWILNCREQHL